MKSSPRSDILRAMNIGSYEDFKQAITQAVTEGGTTRSALARRLEAKGALRAHTVQCLLSTAPVIGRRRPTFDSVLKIAHEAGFDLRLVLKDS